MLSALFIFASICEEILLSAGSNCVLIQRTELVEVRANILYSWIELTAFTLSCEKSTHLNLVLNLEKLQEHSKNSSGKI